MNGMTKKTKLEQTWPDKDNWSKLEPRIMIECSYNSNAATTGSSAI